MESNSLPSENHHSPAVLLTAFNRPGLLLANLSNLRSSGVTNLYISLDGPRFNNEDDNHSHQKILNIIHEQKDNFGTFHLKVNKTNLGCRLAMENAITWFFEHEPCGAIIEDDCMVNASFLKFAKILLDKYQHDDRIAHISGSNFHSGEVHTPYSYYYSAIPHIWGWATWRESWQMYDPDIQLNVLDKMDNYFDNKADLRRYKNEFINTLNGKYDSWAYRWIYTLWKNKHLSITPRVNLVTNTGFGEEGTHTTSKDNSLSNLPAYTLPLPVNHPAAMTICKKADSQLYRKHFRIKRNLPYLKSRLYPLAERHLGTALSTYKKLKKQVSHKK